MHINFFTTRFDIIRFYHSLYTHVMAWIASGSRSAGKNNYDTGNLSDLKWADALDSAIQKCQWKQTRGIPIGSKVVDELAELFLIILDGIMVQRLIDLEIEPTEYSIIRCRDNYDIIANSRDVCTIFERICVSVIIEFELNISFESDWTQRQIVDITKERDLLVGISNLSLNQYLGALTKNKDSTDYGFALDICIVRMKSYFEQKEFYPALCELLKSHPKCIKVVMELVGISNNEGHVKRVSKFMLDNLHDFLLWGITCQFVCLTDFVCKQFEKIGNDWLSPDSVLSKLEKDSIFRDNFMF
eukprot:NODE_682_length_5232_cov_0.148646.p2 type:complete len:301 gc:universal NODE_682_length_5232_cov_0.148646:4529-3627(-)